jgi:hypothetical protein
MTSAEEFYVLCFIIQCVWHIENVTFIDIHYFMLHCSPSSHFPAEVTHVLHHTFGFTHQFLNNILYCV